MYSFTSNTRVRYSETDQMGYVYYGNYASFYEIGRVELFRSLGTSYRELEESGIMMPVYEMKCKYILPAKYDDVTDFYKGFALVKDSYYSSDVKLIDINGKIINSFDKEIEVKATKSNLISLVNEQKTIAVLRSNRKTVIINSKKEIVSKQFAKIINLINGKAFAINYDSKGISEKGLINTKGEFIVKIVKSEF